MEMSDSSTSEVSVHIMELDPVGTLGMEEMTINIKNEPQHWDHIEDKMTCWEEI